MKKKKFVRRSKKEERCINYMRYARNKRSFTGENYTVSGAVILRELRLVLQRLRGLVGVVNVAIREKISNENEIVLKKYL